MVRNTEAAVVLASEAVIASEAVLASVAVIADVVKYAFKQLKDNLALLIAPNGNY